MTTDVDSKLESCSVKRGLNEFPKRYRFNGRYFSLSLHFMPVKGPIVSISRCSELFESNGFLWTRFIKVPVTPNYLVFVYKKQVNLIHAILKYDNYYDFMER